MKLSSPTLAASFVLSALGVAGHAEAHDAKAPERLSVEFIGMPAPTTAQEKTDMYTTAKVKIKYRNGAVRVYDLAYHELMGTTDTIGAKVVGGLYDVDDDPLLDDNGEQIASDAPDGNSLMVIPGMRAAHPWHDRTLALVTHYEYRELPPAGFPAGSYWSKLPATMSLATIDQNVYSGALSVVDYDAISFSSVNGLWIPCAASLSPWNTHLGSEEYEPDAKVRDGGTPAADTDDTTDIASFSQYFFGDPDVANAYHYGLVPEVTVARDGSTSVVMHYALGRIARELAEVMPDKRTVYMGDDGANTGLFMFIADRPTDLSAGTLYGAVWNQTSDAAGGEAVLSWIRLGSSSDAEIRAMVDAGIRFADIFDVSVTDPSDPSFRRVVTYTGTEWLRLRSGMETAAAFLETRRYAAYLGATTEFSKMEGVTHDPTRGPGYNGKAYVVISRVEKGMADGAGDIQVARNDGGAIYELELGGHQRDTAGRRIRSAYVARNMRSVPELLGGWLGGAQDAEGNRCEQDAVCGGDNLKFSPATRTLFIGEDTSRRNNNYVWAFNVQTRKLARILSTPMGAEATGLQVVENANGFAYIMSNFQHPGEGVRSNYLGADKDEVLELLNERWSDLHRTSIGYVGSAHGALPAVK